MKFSHINSIYIILLHVNYTNPIPRKESACKTEKL